MTALTWFLFVGSSILLLAIPGPSAVIVMRHASVEPDRRHVIALAVMLGDMTAMSACNFGLGALLATSAHALTVFRTLAAVYLVALGLWSLRRQDRAGSSRPMLSPRRFRTVFFVTAFNPKGIAFFAAFLPQFIDLHAEVIRQFAVLQATFMALSYCTALVWAQIGACLGGAVKGERVQRRLRQAGGLFLIAIGVNEVFRVG